MRCGIESCSLHFVHNLSTDIVEKLRLLRIAAMEILEPVKRLVLRSDRHCAQQIRLAHPAAARRGAWREPSSEEAEDDLIELTIEARAQRRGRAVRLVLNPTEASAAAAQASPGLINVLALPPNPGRERQRGPPGSHCARFCPPTAQSSALRILRRALTARAGAALAVLQGRAPAQLTPRQIMKQLPYGWRASSVVCLDLRRVQTSVSASATALLRINSRLAEIFLVATLGVVRSSNRTEVRIQLAPPSSPVRTIAISCSIEKPAAT